MKTLAIRLEPWKWDGVICIGGTASEFEAFAKRTVGAVLDIGAQAAGHSYVEYGRPWLIWVHSRRNTPALAHEALHVASGVLEARGLLFTTASEEAYTYTMEYILRQAQRTKGWRAA